MRKGLLEYCILSIIHKNEAYASDILDMLKQANLVVVEGTVYPLLTRMKNEGFLISLARVHWRPPTQVLCANPTRARFARST